MKCDLSKSYEEARKKEEGRVTCFRVLGIRKQKWWELVSLTARYKGKPSGGSRTEVRSERTGELLAKWQATYGKPAHIEVRNHVIRQWELDVAIAAVRRRKLF